MNIEAIRSDKVYRKILLADQTQKDDIYRYELMNQFEYKWACYNIPMKAMKPGGYDIIMANRMLGNMSPCDLGKSDEENIRILSDDSLWDRCTKAIHDAFVRFENDHIQLLTDNYRYTILLPDPESVYTKLSDGCCGDGGIPGSIFLTLIPTSERIARIPSVLAHECNHNLRFQYIKWNNNITLEEMMINEGLAENFATWMYGEENLGPWVRAVDKETLYDYIIPIIKGGLKAQGFDRITSYLYGDEIAIQRGYIPEGLPFCAGYACGYYMIQYFLKKTGIPITKATIMPYEDIIKELEGFYDIQA